MKILMDAITALGIMSCSLFTGNDDIPANEVPSVVRNTFSTEFPDAMDLEWEKKRQNFEVDFEINNTDHSALFNKTGIMLMHKKDVAIEMLPAAVKQTLLENFTYYKIEDVEKLEKGDATYYQVELEGKFLDRNEIFSTDGQVAAELSYWD